MPSPEKFMKSLLEYNIPEDIRNRINVGYERLKDSSPKKEKAEYFRHAMCIFDESIKANELGNDNVTKLMDYNGCCKSGAREKASKTFAKENSDKTLAQKVKLICSVKNMGKPKLLEDGRLYILAVQYHDGIRFRCPCPNFNSSLEYLNTSKTYCRCCAGHFRYHYQIMLDVKLELIEVASSPLGSNGGEPCAFMFRILD